MVRQGVLGVLLTACILGGSGGEGKEKQDMKRPLNVAHRGGAGLAPENTLVAFRQALAWQVDAVELDVHMSQDGALIVMHDPDLGRTTRQRGEIRARTLAELRTLNAAASHRGAPVEPQPIPTLQEVLDLVKGRAGVQIEIKLAADNTRYPGIEAKVVEVVRHLDMLADVIVISFDFPTLQDIRALDPRLATCALISASYLSRFDVRRDATSAVDDLIAQGFRCVGIRHTLLTEVFYKTLRAHGFRVGVWTVNEPSAMRQFAAMGVDFITSDRPDLLRDIVP
jgi:glycerophosphoryl diester phosphodiesterase